MIQPKLFNILDLSKHLNGFACKKKPLAFYHYPVSIFHVFSLNYPNAQLRALTTPKSLPGAITFDGFHNYMAAETSSSKRQ